jgi:peptide/nickel transport system ATP-binding protein
MTKTVLEVDNLSVDFPARRGLVKAVRNVSFELYEGEALALIGESGSGKTTLGLSLVRLLPKTARIREGRILYKKQDGSEQDVLLLNTEGLRSFRWKECAMVFQGAQNAFNPVLRIEDQFFDTARAHGIRDKEKVRAEAADLLRRVQLDPSRVLSSYPHELSGGMRQRVLIALGLLLKPQIVVLDEPTTALDILTQRSVIEVLRSVRDEFNFSLIFISHDLSLAAELADRVATVYAGKIVEIGNVFDIFEKPRHPYTKGLTQTVPTVTGELRELISIPGSPPDLINPPTGCAFNPRCPYATERCRKEQPPLEEVGEGQFAACWNWREIAEK